MRTLDRKIYTAILAAWVLGMIAAVRPWSWFHQEPRLLSTRVTVFEGSVAFYRIGDDGGQELIQILHSGETGMYVAEANKEYLRFLKNRARAAERPAKAVELKKKGGIFGFYSLMRVLLPREADFYNDWLKAFMAQYPDDVFTRIFTEEEFAKYTAGHIVRRTPIESLDTVIEPEGFYMTGRMKLGIFTLNFSGHGVCQIDKAAGDKPYIEIRTIKIGPINLPQFVLRQIEEDFDEWIEENRRQLALKITRIQYQRGGAMVTYKKDY